MLPNGLSDSGWSLLVALGNHVWQSTLFAAVVALLALRLRRNHARIRYWLWLTASIKFFIPFSLLVMAGSHLSWTRRPSRTPAVQWSAASVVAVEEMSQPFSRPDDLFRKSTQQTAVPFLRVAPGVAPERPEPSAKISLPVFLEAIWLAGVLGIVARWTMRWWELSRALRNATPLRVGREVEALRRMEQVAGLQRRIDLRSIPISVEPGVFGLTRPILFWPQAISKRLDDTHLETILLHEVWHVRRYDNLTAVVHMVVEAVFWFHPLVWWVETRLVKERERA